MAPRPAAPFWHTPHTFRDPRRSSSQGLSGAVCIEFFLAGPPEGLRKQLEQFATRTKPCRREPAALARELSFTEFIREA
eukprot:790377-Pyramimonas_sp.AAC.1